jgi:hypothetical protein
MVMVENIIVKGKYFFPAKPDQIINLKRTLQEYLVKKNFMPEDMITALPQDRFLTANYKFSFGELGHSMGLKLKRHMHFISDEDANTKTYFKKLAAIRKEIPFKVKICLCVATLQNVEGIGIEITSIPVAYYHLTQINNKLHLSKEDYGKIKYENTEIIKELMASIHAQTVSEPNLLSEYIRSEILEKLISYKFNKISELLENGKKKLELGENATSDIIGVIENFLFELVERINIKPAGRDNPGKNISKLKTAGFLTDRTEGIIQSSLFNSVYGKLKDVDHKKENIDYFDQKLYFGITESIIDYLLDRVVKYRIKYTTIKSDEKQEMK